MMHGYARVSTDGQSVEAQVAALTAAGAVTVYRVVASGAKTDGAKLRQMLARLAAGDVPDVPTSTLDFTFFIRYISCQTSIDVLTLDCGGHHDVAPAQTSQSLSRRLPEPAARHGIS